MGLGIESLLVFLPAILLLVLANYTERRKDLRPLTIVFLGLSIAMFVSLAILTITISQSSEGPGAGVSRDYGFSVLITSLLAILPMSRVFRRWASWLIGIDEDNWLHATVMVFAILLAGLSISTAATTDVVSLGKEAGVSITGILLQDVLFVLAALLGVGWAVRRNWVRVMERLGLKIPGLKEISFSVIYVLVILLAVMTVGIISQFFGLGPDVMDMRNDPTIEIMGSLSLLTVIVVALSAGVAEEILFRGAMQPRFGLVLTSVLFALVHIQYFNISGMAVLLLVGLILGHERMRFGTTACIMTHALYDILALSAATMV